MIVKTIYDKVTTLEDILTTFPGGYSEEISKALCDDIVSFAGDSKVVEVSEDVGAYLCVSYSLDFSMTMQATQTPPHEKISKLYLGKIPDTDIHLYGEGDYDYLKSTRISVEMAAVAVAEERSFKAEYHISPEGNDENRKYYGHVGRVGDQFNQRMNALRKLFDSFPGTDFQKRLWHYLRTIPRGEVRTYKEVAEAIGHPNAYRAVASACAKNPDAPNTPCHRVVASNGIGGYSGKNGIPGKIKLLREEGVDVSKYL